MTIDDVRHEFDIRRRVVETWVKSGKLKLTNEGYLKTIQDEYGATIQEITEYNQKLQQDFHKNARYPTGYKEKSSAMWSKKKKK